MLELNVPPPHAGRRSGASDAFLVFLLGNLGKRHLAVLLNVPVHELASLPLR